VCDTGDDDDEIDDEPILFEGRDYNHWFIVFDFPKDNKPTPEEMIRLYEETCAKGLNIRLWFFTIINTKFKIKERKKIECV